MTGHFLSFLYTALSQHFWCCQVNFSKTLHDIYNLLYEIENIFSFISSMSLEISRSPFYIILKTVFQGLSITKILIN